MNNFLQDIEKFFLPNGNKL